MSAPSPDLKLGAKLNPQPGNRFRKWDQVFQVTEVRNGRVSTLPQMSSRRSLALEYFRLWARNAEVIQ